MRIAMTARQYDKKGGISRYVAEHAERFAGEHEVHVYSSSWEDVGNKDIIFHRTPLPKAPILIEAVTYFLEISAITKLRGGKYDIFHTEGLESLWPGVVTAHSIHRATLQAMKNIGELRPLGLMDKYLLTVERLNYEKYRRYEKIIADATSGKRELMKYYGVPEEDIVVIPLGVNPEEFRPLPEDAVVHLREKYGFDEGDVVLLIVATEFYRKGMVELLQAVGMLVNQRGCGNVRLLVVGKARDEGSRRGDVFYRELAQRLGISKNVVFTGLVEDLNAHYNLADIFVLPTKYEAFGIPTLEAMSAGLPVINSRIGAGELIEDGKSGILLDDPNNPEEIAERIEALIRDESLRSRLGRNARCEALKYSWDAIAARTMEVYEEVLRG